MNLGFEKGQRVYVQVSQGWRPGTVSQVEPEQRIDNRRVVVIVDMDDGAIAYMFERSAVRTLDEHAPCTLAQ